MSLEFDVPVQFWALLAGWSFTLYLQSRSNRRAEALKRKDKIIDKIDGLVEWVQDEVNKDSFSSEDAETCYTSLLTQIELRTHQFNAHVKLDLLSIGSLARLREIDFFEKNELNRYPFIVRDIAFDFIDDIEIKCNELYFGGGGFVNRVKRFFNVFIAEWVGVFVGLLSLILLGLLIDFVSRLYGA